MRYGTNKEKNTELGEGFIDDWRGRDMAYERRLRIPARKVY